MLINVFRLYRPDFLDEDETNDTRILQGGEWGRERWWYKLAHVCGRWRSLILGSASYLNLSLLCTYGTPVADMLAHSSPLPLVIDYLIRRPDITAEDEEGIMLALQHRHRVHRIRLEMTMASLQKSINSIDKEFPMLKFLYLAPRTAAAMDGDRLTLPETFQAPQLHHLVLTNFSFVHRSPLLTTAFSLVALSLSEHYGSAYILPGKLLQLLSLMLQLEVLVIAFDNSVIVDPSEMAHVTLPNLRWFAFQGLVPYLEVLLPRITTPLVEKLTITLSSRLPISLPSLQQFMGASEKLMVRSARFTFFDGGVTMLGYPHEGARKYTIRVGISCRPYTQLFFTTQFFNALDMIRSTVECLTVAHSLSSEVQSDLDLYPILWRDFLRLFCNVKTLFADHKLIGVLSRSLRLDDGEPRLDRLPELKELEYLADGEANDPFLAFVDAD